MWWSLGAGRRAIRGCLNPSLIFLGQDVKHVSFELKMYIFRSTGGRSLEISKVMKVTQKHVNVRMLLLFGPFFITGDVN